MLKSWMNKFRKSLSARIFLITAAMLMAVSGITYAIIAFAFPLTYTFVVNDALEEETLRLVEELEQVTLEECGPLLDRFMAATGATAMIFDAENQPVYLPGDPQPHMEEHSGEFELRDKDVTGETQQEESVMSIHGDQPSFDFSFLDSDEICTLSVASTSGAVNPVTEAVTRIIPYLCIAILMISLISSLLYSRYITRPIVGLSRTSQCMADLDFTHIYNGKRIDEIGMLGQNLNRLSGNLSQTLTELKSANEQLQKDILHKQELEQQRTTFFSAASHELKTPVTILKGQLRGMLEGVGVYKDRDKYLGRSLKAAERIERLVREILEVSRMENIRVEQDSETVDLSELTEAYIGQVRELARQKDISLRQDIGPGILVQGNGALLGKAVSNLLSNAVVYSPDKAAVSVTLERQQGQAALRIENSGVQLPEDALPHLFEAFYVTDPSRSRETGGSGLGLYLSRQIFDRHGARCEIVNTETGVRATVTFST